MLLELSEVFYEGARSVKLKNYKLGYKALYMYNCKNEGTLKLFQNNASDNLKPFLERFEYFWIKQSNRLQIIKINECFIELVSSWQYFV